MSAREASQATREPTSAGAPGVHPEVHDDHHPTPRQYVNIALILALLTALEVSLFYVDVGALFVPTMIVLMVTKFVMVVGYFMHLKYDTKLYRNLMLAGLFTALAVYGAALATFVGVTPVS